MPHLSRNWVGFLDANIFIWFCFIDKMSDERMDNVEQEMYTGSREFEETEFATPSVNSLDNQPPNVGRERDDS